MAALNFPAAPALGDKYPQPAIVNVPTYTWDGEKWTTTPSLGVSDAPANDILYGRINNTWSEVPQGAAAIGEWTYSPTLTAPPSSGQMRLNNANQASVTKIFLSNITALSKDVKILLNLLIQTNSKIYLQDKDNSTKYVIYNVLETPTQPGTYTDISVVMVEQGGHLSSGQRCLISVVNAGSSGGPVTYAQLPDGVQKVPIVFPFGGMPAAGAIVNVPISMPMQIAGNLVGTVVYSGTLAGANTPFTLNKISGGATTTVGVVTITPASHTSCDLVGAGASLVAGDTLQLVAPSQDASLADVGITIQAMRV